MGSSLHRSLLKFIVLSFFLSDPKVKKKSPNDGNDGKGTMAVRTIFKFHLEVDVHLSSSKRLAHRARILPPWKWSVVGGGATTSSWKCDDHDVFLPRVQRQHSAASYRDGILRSSLFWQRLRWIAFPATIEQPFLPIQPSWTPYDQ